MGDVASSLEGARVERFLHEEVELPLKLLMNHEVSISADSLSLRLLLEFCKQHNNTTNNCRVKEDYWWCVFFIGCSRSSNTLTMILH